ncbi:Aste57867_14554 [Aphanomyces stellatus]|uniref:Amino acid transporter n=1 Tax=Aphanomyces stellatus TaxID=120398 RepID=A0A485L106_9STRA|nr:hypothetical protein As57867_014500 [Aphanomyces stellatus]VFT91374.1 Aste57867_14554 [Aphanomyces stellatus]
MYSATATPPPPTGSIILYDPTAAPPSSNHNANDHVVGQQQHHHHAVLPLAVDFRQRSTPPTPGTVDRGPFTSSPPRVPRFTILGPKSPSVQMIIGSLVGLVLGLALAAIFASTGRPDWFQSLNLWIQLPGTLFIRALKCAIVPMVLANTAASVADAVLSGRVKQLLGWRTVGLFVLSSTLSAITGVVLAAVFVTFGAKDAPVAAAAVDDAFQIHADVTFRCRQAANVSAFLANVLDVPFCAPRGQPSLALTLVSRDPSPWVLTDDGKPPSTDLTAHLMLVLDKFVTDNVLGSMANMDLLSVIVLAVPIGVAAAAAATHLDLSPRSYSLDALLRCVRDAFVLLLGWLIDLTPYAMVSIIAGALLDSAISSTEGRMNVFFADAGRLIGLIFAGGCIHVLVVLPALYFCFTRRNPFAFMQAMAPVYVFALGSASSMATIPLAISTTIATKQVPKIVPQFVFPIATVVNANAAGIYMAIHVAFLAVMEHVVISIDQFILLFLVSLLASIGTPPIPHGGLVMIVTIWKTVLRQTSIPPSFQIVVACDVITDRIATLINVHGNLMVTRIVAEQVDATVVEALETRHSQRVDVHDDEDDDNSMRPHVVSHPY